MLGNRVRAYNRMRLSLSILSPAFLIGGLIGLLGVGETWVNAERVTGSSRALADATFLCLGLVFAIARVTVFSIAAPRTNPRKCAAGPRRMPACIQEHVGDRVPNLARSAKHADVIPIREHRTASPEDAVHSLREPRTDCLHSAPERFPILCFDDHMRVVALERVVNETKRVAFTPPRERVLDLAHELHCSQRGNIASNLDGDVSREQAGEAFARAVADARIPPGLPSGAGPSPAVPDAIEFQLFRLPTHYSVD